LASDKVTIAVDYQLKHAYEMTFPPGKAVYKEILEEAMLNRIEEVNPVKACELRIERLRKMLADEEHKLDDYNILEQMKKLETKKQSKTKVDPALEKMRLDKFSVNKLTIAKQVQKGNADWKKFAEVYLFDTPNEAKKWTMVQLQEAELLG
jgi:hypothetical protein